MPEKPKFPVQITRRRLLAASTGIGIPGLAGCKGPPRGDRIPDADQSQAFEGKCKNQFENPSATCNDEIPQPVYLIREAQVEKVEFMACPLVVGGVVLGIAHLAPAVAASVGSSAVTKVGIKATEKVLKKGLNVCGEEYEEMQKAKQALKDEIERRKKEAAPG